MKQFWKNKLVFGILIAVIVTGTMILLSGFDDFSNWQHYFADNLYEGNNPSNQIVLVAVDQNTLDQKDGLGEYTSWNRDNFAQVLENINKYDPKVVAFDFFFKAGKDESGDNHLKVALENTKKPIIVYTGNPQKYDPGKGYYMNPTNQKPVILPLALFSDIKSIQLSVQNALKDNDNVSRKLLPIIFDEKLNRYDENLAFAAARKALDGEELPLQPKIIPGEYTLTLKDGRNINIPLEDGQMLINFFSTPDIHTYPLIPFVDVYKENYNAFGNNPSSLFKDKIIIIGPWAKYFNDTYITPVSSKVAMPGVEIFANALQTILEQKFLRNLTFAEKSILIIILALTAAFTFMFTKIRWSLLYLFGVPTAYYLAAKPMFNSGIILDLTHPYVTVAVTFVAVYLYRYVTEFKEKLELQSAFGKYVNPTLVKQISEHPEALKLGGETREITVLFTDIAHSTTISEKLKPESLVALLNEYFEAMSDVIMAEGGTLDKFVGDEIMAFFGAPVPQPDHALRATRAALNMRIKLNQLLEKWKTATPGPDGISANLLPGGEPKPPIDFRCGLSSGEVIVGNIGSSTRFNYTVMGDIVNLGSRLEGANKKYNSRIMMSQKTQELIKDQFETRELDIIQVVGKTEPIKVFELLAPKGQLPQDVLNLLQQYNEAIDLYHNRKFAEALAKFTTILQSFPEDGPSQLYRQRCEVLRDFPPKPDWNGVFEMGSK